MKITSIDKDIKQLFSSGFYKIPRFQRPYSWDRDNLDEFWNDVNDNDGGDYFLGSMVVYKNDNESFNLVDGQQRLTTITILLCAIRNRFFELGEDNLAKGIHTVVEKPDIIHKQQYVIQTETSHPYFQLYIQNYEKPDHSPKIRTEEKKLNEAFIFFKEKLKDLESPNKPKEVQSLTNLRIKLLSLSLVYIELDSEEDAYVIFETLNTRGKDLAASDLIKNLYTKLIKNANKNLDIVKEKWAIIYENIQSISNTTHPDQFMLHFWLSQGKYINLKNLYKNYKLRIKPSNAKNELDNLVNNSKYYRDILSPQKYKDSKLKRKVLLKLKIFKNGRVDSIQVLNTAIEQEFIDSALTIVSRTTFSPGVYKNKNVNCYHTIPINFSMDEDED